MTVHATHLSELARQLRPDLHIVSVSTPDPRLGRHNVVAEAGSTEEARQAVVDLENQLGMDARIGLVVLSAAPAERPPGRIDPEGVTGSVARRAALGAAIGAAVGAVLGAVLGLLWTEVGGPIGAALGGAALLGVFGGIWGAFTKMGGSDAYRQTFVEPQQDDVVLLTFHGDDPDAADEVRRFLRGQAGLRLLDIADA